MHLYKIRVERPIKGHEDTSETNLVRAHTARQAQDMATAHYRVKHDLAPSVTLYAFVQAGE